MDGIVDMTGVAKEQKGMSAGAGLVWGVILGLLAAYVTLGISMKIIRPSDPATAVMKVETLQKEVATLTKFKTDCDVAVPAVAQKLDSLAASHERLVAALSQALQQQQFDVAVMARALSDDFGKEQWMSMVEKARAEMVGAPASTNVEAAVEAPKAEKKEKAKK
jgi:translation elongation factor EF-G